MVRLLDMLLPPACPGCRQEGEPICSVCVRGLRRRMKEPAAAPIGLRLELPAGLAQLEWCAAYTGTARKALHALKYDGELRLVAPLADLMAERWRRAGVGGEWLVPVPVHAHKRRQRGFDQAELLARAVGERLRLPVVTALERTERTAAQHDLGRRERASNVGHAFVTGASFERRLRGRWVVLIDDVVTTGATLAGCARALYASGAGAVSALSLARER